MIRTIGIVAMAALYSFVCAAADAPLAALERARAEGNSLEQRLRAEDPHYDIKKALVLDTVDLTTLPPEQRARAFEDQYKKTSITVLVRYDGDDRIGQRLSSWFKEEIDRSSMMHTGYSSTAFTANMVTVPIRQDSTAYSVAITRNKPPLEIYITSVVGICSIDRLESCASEMAGFLRAAVEQYAGVSR